MGDIPVVECVFSFLLASTLWKSYHWSCFWLTGWLIKDISKLPTYTASGKSTRSHSLTCTWTSLRCSANLQFNRTGVGFGEGHPGGTSAWWKLVALSLIGGEFNFSNEPGTFQFLIRFAQWLTQQIFAWQTAQSIPVAVDWNHFYCYSHTGQQGHLKVIVAGEMYQDSNACCCFSKICLGKGLSSSSHLILSELRRLCGLHCATSDTPWAGSSFWRSFPKSKDLSESLGMLNISQKVLPRSSILASLRYAKSFLLW